MYSKEEAKAIKEAFWTTFGKWSLQKRKSEGKGKWLLNRTGVKGYRMKFEAEGKKLCVCLEIIDPDDIIRQIRYEKLLTLKTAFDSVMDNLLIWEPDLSASGKPVARVYVQKQGLTIHNKSQWPNIFAFFYEQMSRLEEVFETYRDYLQED